MQTRKTRKLDIREEEYFRIISDKTASLISACCEIGALSASNDPNVHHAFKEFGENLGIAFQIRDDIFDYTSSESAIGKPTGNDIQERKLTLPLIRALNSAPRKEARSIIKQIRDSNGVPSATVKNVSQFVNHYQGLDYAQEQSEIYRDRARRALHDIPDSKAKQSLIDFTEFVISRKQ